MQASEKLFLQIIGRFVGERFRTWVAPILGRIEQIEKHFAQHHTVAPDDIQHMVESAVANYLTARADFARADVSEMIAVAVAKIPAGPPGKDGANGADGADGRSITAADLEDIMDAKVAGAVDQRPVEPHVVSGFIDRAGDLHFTGSDGGVFKVGHVVGADADPAKIVEAIKAEFAKIPLPKDGKDGFSLTDFNMCRTGQRSVTLSFESGDIKKEFTVTFAMPLYQGVWHEGGYLEGDCVTHEGSTWIALQDTSTRPGTTDSGWQLAIKRGRDGREGKPGQPGPAGKDGRDGRDLTQLGPDGKKW